MAGDISPATPIGCLEEMLIHPCSGRELDVSTRFSQALANFLKLYEALGMSIFLAKLTGFP